MSNEEKTFYVLVPVKVESRDGKVHSHSLPDLQEVLYAMSGTISFQEVGAALKWLRTCRELLSSAKSVIHTANELF